MKATIAKGKVIQRAWQRELNGSAFVFLRGHLTNRGTLISMMTREQLILAQIT